MTTHAPIPRRAALAAIALTSLSAAACAPHRGDDSTSAQDTEGYPVELESCGGSYTYDSAPQRVLLGAAGTIRTLDALGIADSVIGFTNADYADPAIKGFPRASLSTADFAPSREFLLSARPDLFLSNDEQQLLGDGSASKEDLASVPGNLYVMGQYCQNAAPDGTMDLVYTDISHLGAVFQVQDAAKTLTTELSDRVEKAASRAAQAADQKAGAIMINENKVYALSGSYYSAVLTALGFTNGFSDMDSAWTEVSKEAVMASDLEVLMVVSDSDDTNAAEAAARSAFSDAPAVTNDRVAVIRSADFESAGVVIVDIVESLAKQLFG